MASFIDHVRCGKCDAGLTLEQATVVMQRYRRQPWLGHFWVRCDICLAPKLYWPTARQMRLAVQLKCQMALDDCAPANVTASYARSHRMPAISAQLKVDIPSDELEFLLSMLAATSGPTPAGAPPLSYLPPSWLN